ncbi:low molecular weight phosphotyrosine protein phosphatase [Kiritimatiellaeota bacterium B1221]|nr:low molecular weight phosphotyrosine protein phosphatase [Kiritimatiellaeota bacterium B1221]
MMSDKIHKVLFVCLGNICRSPSAEAVFKSKVDAAGLSNAFEIDSAGILSVHAGDAADARMRKHALARGYKLESRSRPVVPQDFRHFDYIIGMDHANISDLLDRAPDLESKAKVSLFLDVAPELKRKEVPDPYYGGAAGFEEVLDLCEAASEKLLVKLQHES